MGRIVRALTLGCSLALLAPLGGAQSPPGNPFGRPHDDVLAQAQQDCEVFLALGPEEQREDVRRSIPALLELSRVIDSQQAFDPGLLRQAACLASYPEAIAERRRLLCTSDAPELMSLSDFSAMAVACPWLGCGEDATEGSPLCRIQGD